MQIARDLTLVDDGKVPSRRNTGQPRRRKKRKKKDAGDPIADTSEAPFRPPGLRVGPSRKLWRHLERGCLPLGAHVPNTCPFPLQKICVVLFRCYMPFPQGKGDLGAPGGHGGPNPCRRGCLHRFDACEGMRRSKSVSGGREGCKKTDGAVIENTSLKPIESLLEVVGHHRLDSTSTRGRVIRDPHRA